MTASSQRRKPRWIKEMSSVLVALAQSRRTLRRAARVTSDRRMSQRLRRLARRRRAAAEELKRTAPTAASGALDAAPVVTQLPDQIRTASEVGVTAACLRANRKLRATIDATLEADPPSGVRQRLEALRSQTDYDADALNAQLRRLIVVAVPAGEDSSKTADISEQP